MIARLWMGYILIKNSGIGTITPLESLGMPDEMLAIFQALWRTNFLMHAAKLMELLGGIALVFNFHIPLVLLGLLPVVVNIYGIHIFLFGSFFTKGLGMLVICIYLVFKHRDKYRPLLARK